MKADLPIWAVVPVKDTTGAKQRLRDALPPGLRRDFALAMLEDVLAALAAAPGLADILVVTSDEEACRVAARYSATTSACDAGSGHTAAVMGAAHRLAALRAAMLTIPGDIPLATTAEIEQMIASYRSGNRFTIAPARDQHGSNAILAAPADAVPLRFGEDSFFPHLAAAHRCGIEPAVLRLPGIGLDIDTPDDLAAFLSIGSRTMSRALLDGAGVRAA